MTLKKNESKHFFVIQQQDHHKEAKEKISMDKNILRKQEILLQDFNKENL